MKITNRKTLIKAMKAYKEEYIGMLNDATHIIKHGKFLIRGGACNVGLLIDDGWMIDDTISLEENILQFIDSIELDTIKL